MRFGITESPKLIQSTDILKIKSLDNKSLPATLLQLRLNMHKRSNIYAEIFSLFFTNFSHTMAHMHSSSPVITMYAITPHITA